MPGQKPKLAPVVKHDESPGTPAAAPQTRRPHQRIAGSRRLVGDPGLSDAPRVYPHPWGGPTGLASTASSLLRTGCGRPWTPRLGSGAPAHGHLPVWAAAGVYLRWGQQGRAQDDTLQGLDWSGWSRDGTRTQAPGRDKEPAPIPRTGDQKAGMGPTALP